VNGQELNAIEVVGGWMDAMRRGDLDAVASWFDPTVTWQGIPRDAVCRNRDEVLDMLGDSMKPCAEEARAEGVEEGLYGAEAIELVGAADVAALGAKLPDLIEVGDIPVPGQLFDVFRVRDGRILEVRDYAFREEALRAAG
jgi:limonene-1,2-epoxide hydrolase